MLENGVIDLRCGGCWVGSAELVADFAVFDCGSGCCELGFGGFGVVFRGFSFANAGVWVGDAAIMWLVFFMFHVLFAGIHR